MGFRRGVLATFAVGFLLPPLSGVLGGPGVRGAEAFAFSVLAFACIAALSARFLARSKSLLVALLFLVVFALLQGIAWSVFLVLSLFGKWAFSWGYLVLGPVGLAAALLCVRSLGLKGEARFHDPGGPGPLAPA